MRIYNAVVLDFDGTLLDSYKIGLKQIDALAKQEGLAITPQIRETLMRTWGRTGVSYLQDAFGISRERAKAMFVKWQQMEMMEPPPLIEGVPETLDWLREEGYLICMLTSRDRLAVLSYLERAYLRGHFAHITAHEDTVYHKPDGRAFAGIFRELQKHGVPRKQCLFVGDTAVDIETGRNAGVRTVVVETGPYNHGHHQTHPVPEDHIISSVMDLPEWIEAVRKGKL